MFVCCYLAPDNLATSKRVVTYISQCPCGAALLVVGNFNTDLATLEVVSHREDIAASIISNRLEEISAHFLPRHKSRAWDWRMWFMFRLRRKVRSWTDCLLVTDSHMFCNVSVCYRCYNSDHFMVLECLRSASQQEHTSYLGRRRRFLLRPPQQQTQEDRWCADLRQVITKPASQGAPL